MVLKENINGLAKENKQQKSLVMQLSAPWCTENICSCYYISV